MFSSLILEWPTGFTDYGMKVYTNTCTPTAVQFTRSHCEKNREYTNNTNRLTLNSDSRLYEFHNSTNKLITNIFYYARIQTNTSLAD